MLAVANNKIGATAFLNSRSGMRVNQIVHKSPGCFALLGGSARPEFSLFSFTCQCLSVKAKKGIDSLIIHREAATL